ncbi:glycosyltransferase [Jiulongibacter sp. NS-SX5]|uniref:glycosyltransferase n=1 Tax=Jiulongibacter sp. NS-SX5 TaxID=3463854 RepID=UPI0040595A1E
MTVAFTICSNNYISQAKALADSMAESNPDIKFYIGLADDFEGIPEQYRQTYSKVNIIEVKEVEILNFDWMEENYDIIEFNTSVKPFYFSHLMNLHPEAENIIFFDPDIYVYQPLKDLKAKLREWNIVLTPHLTQPITDDRNEFYTHEHDILNHGVFNLGFVAINTSEESKRFIKWWEERLATQCIHDLCNGLFVDQLWCNLVPSYFDKVLIDKDPGMNMAYWNLQERTISTKNGVYFVNEDFPLSFFHFSTFNPTIEDNIATKQNRYKLSDRPDLQPLYTAYQKEVEENHFTELKSIPCVYGKPLAKPKAPSKLAVKLGFPFKVMVNLIEKYL